MTADTGRAPPGFLVYAASRLADRNRKLMTPVELGLESVMECECWVNGDVPAEPADLARVIGWSLSSVEAGLTPRLMRYFERRGDVIESPELLAYREKLDTNYENRAAAGRRNIEAVN